MNKSTSTPAPKQVDNEVSAVKAFRKRKPRTNNNLSAFPTSGRTKEDDTETQEIKAIPSLPIEVSTEDCLFDRIEIKAEHGCVIGSCEDSEHSKEEVDLFRWHLGAPPVDHREGYESEHYGKLATVSPKLGKGYLPISIRKKPIRYAGKLLQTPLFKGIIRMWRTMSDKEEICRIFSSLDLNLSRAINHQGNGKSVLKHHTQAELECGLDGNDNIVPSALDKKAAHKLQMEHIKEVYNTLLQELQRASKAIDGFPLKGSSTLTNKGFSLRDVETYYEFEVDNAASLLKAITPALRAYHRRTRTRIHGQKFDHAFDLSTDSNSQTVTLHLGNGESIKIYTKKHNVIRIEVTHNPSKQTNLLKEGIVANDMPELASRLASLKNRTVKRINDLLSFIREWHEESPQDRAKAPHYASRWFQSLGHGDVSENVYELLCNNGRIVLGKSLGQAEKNLIRRAKGRGLVFHDRGFVYAEKVVKDLTNDQMTNSKVAHNSETHSSPQDFTDAHSIKVLTTSEGSPSLSAILLIQLSSVLDCP